MPTKTVNNNKMQYNIVLFCKVRIKVMYYENLWSANSNADIDIVAVNDVIPIYNSIDHRLVLKSSNSPLKASSDTKLSFPSQLKTLIFGLLISFAFINISKL